MIKNIIYLIAVLCFFSCAGKRVATAVDYNFKSVNGAPDYGSLDYWAAHPAKTDPSDSLPKKLKKSFRPDTTADVFFLYPTSYLDRLKPYGWNAPIDDAAINQKTDYSSILYQASIFNAAGRVFAPRYRQANYHAYLSGDTAAALAAFDLAYSDVKSAFEYYLTHYNNGRPIIIASHSQGTTHAKRLLKEFFDDKPLQNQLVVAYMAGMPVEPDWFSSIPVCKNPTQTGCFCSWRTFRKGYTDSFVQKEDYVAVVTNPITWDSSKPIADRFSNKGGVLYKFKKIVPKVAAAEVHEGVLWTKKPHFFGNIFLKRSNYHIADYNLYYMNIRQNAVDRLHEYIARQQH